jgi:N-acetylneuraminate epimerase
MNKPIFLLITLFMIAALNERVVKAQSVSKFEWSILSPIPNKIGFAGSFAGVASNALIVAGGANFPDGGAPWTGSVKAWTDQIFVLESPDGQWKEAGKLPQKLGYGVSVNYKNSLILIGGSNEKGHHADVLMLDYENGQIEIANLPKLPQPIANTCGVILGDVLYVLGGIVKPDDKKAGTNFWALDLSSAKKEWKVLETWPGAGRMLSVSGALNESLYLFSGVELIDGQRKYLTDAYQYSKEKGWKRIADLPSSVAAAPSPAFALDKNELVIFGGDDGVQALNAAVLREKHPGFSKQVLSYASMKNSWTVIGEVMTDKKDDAVVNPNGSIWAPVTTTLTVWKGNVILPGGEVRPATRTPNVLVAKPFKK